MAQCLAKLNLFFDELNKIRVLEPEVSTQTQTLRDECKTFVEKINEFQNLSGDFVNILDELGGEVEKEKMLAIGANNYVQLMKKQRDMQTQQLQSIIAEKSTELERLKVQSSFLQKTELEQQEMIDTLLYS